MVLLSGPNLNGNELKYVTECIETGWVSSVGAYVDQFEKMTADPLPGNGNCYNFFIIHG